MMKPRVESLEGRRLLTAAAFEVVEVARTFGEIAFHSEAAVDIDLDGDLDFIGINLPKQLVWLEYDSDSERLVAKHKIGFNSKPKVLIPADVDGDGGLDVLVSGKEAGSKLAWFENVDGYGKFASRDADEHVSVASYEELEDGGSITRLEGGGVMAVADIEGDGLPDVVIAVVEEINLRTGPHSNETFFRQRISYYENKGGSFTGNHFYEMELSDDVPLESLITEIQLVDINGDGGLDVLASYQYGNRLVWFEQIGADDFDHEPQLITDTESPRDVAVGDLDNDGNLDLLIANMTDGRIARYAYHQETGFQFVGYLVDDMPYIHFAKIADMNIDGLPDVLMMPAIDPENPRMRPDTRLRILYQQPDLSFSPPHLVAHVPQTNQGDVDIVDVDMDGDLDIVLPTDIIDEFVYIFKQRVLGDVNDDGVFDSSDLITVFQAAKYENGEDGETTYDEGDWNGDREFTTADLVFAFQAGTYADAIQEAIDPLSDDALGSIAAALNENRRGRAYVA